MRPRPFIGVWSRGAGKSTNAEIACIAIGERRIRRYGVYVCNTQKQADDHIENVGALLESPQMAIHSPHMANRKIGKYGTSKGWRRNRLHTDGGFTLDSFGLDTAIRGAKVESDRLGFIVIDEIDRSRDTELQILKKIDLIKSSLIPAGSSDVAIMGVQNLIHSQSIFARLVDGRAKFLADKILSGPYKALDNFSYEITDEGKAIVTGGDPTWAGFSLEICQKIITATDINTFRTEYQHEAVAGVGAMFGDAFQEGVHIIEPFIVPYSWKIYRAFDWGFSKPFAFGWWAVSDGTVAPNGRHYPKGTMILVKEWYGWNSEPNVGMRLETREMGRRGRVIDEQVEHDHSMTVLPGPADASIFDTISGVNYSEQLAESDLYFERSNKRPGSRRFGWKVLYDRFKASIKIPMEEKGIFVFKDCTQWIRTVPTLPRDLKDPDDCDSSKEDHHADKTRYMALFLEESSGTMGITGV